jgi:hypothetical protein
MLARALPKTPLISFESATADEQFLVVRASSDTDPGNWYLYDPRRNRWASFPRHDRRSGQDPLADEVGVVSRRRRHADSRLPDLASGVTDAKNLPAIVLPHGGPGARDEWGFDWLSQFFAQRDTWSCNPTSAARAASARTVCQQWHPRLEDFDRRRLRCGTLAGEAGHGGSVEARDFRMVLWWLRGFAVQCRGSDLFKAVVAVAPVTDFALMKTKALQYTNAS